MNLVFVLWITLDEEFMEMPFKMQRPSLCTYFYLRFSASGTLKQLPCQISNKSITSSNTTTQSIVAASPAVTVPPVSNTYQSQEQQRYESWCHCKR